MAKGKQFEGSEIVLYIWMTAYIVDVHAPSPNIQQSNLTCKFKVRPVGITNCEGWVRFLKILTKVDIKMNMGWNGSQFFIERHEDPVITLCSIIIHPQFLANSVNYRANK